jgi:myo-inositol-1(or 4)-monophosphatase
MHPEHKSEFLGTAFRAAILAGDLILENLGKLTKTDISEKDTSDFVTKVDRESENLIISVIKNKHPDHHFLAEESVKQGPDEGYRWIIDPLDGTTNFIHSYPVFSISIALEHRGEIIMGVVYDPLREELFTAEKGYGTFLNGHQVSISSVKNLGDSLIATGFPFRKKTMIDLYLDLFKNVFNKVSDIRRAGSAALDFAHLACGRCDGFFELGLSPWDMAAGSILIAEAGGVVSDFGGGSDYLESGNIVASTPLLHDKLLKEVKGVFSGTIDR